MTTGYIETYTYDPAGNVLSIADTPQNGQADRQCFREDHLGRLHIVSLADLSRPGMTELVRVPAMGLPPRRQLGGLVASQGDTALLDQGRVGDRPVAGPTNRHTVAMSGVLASRFRSRG